MNSINEFVNRIDGLILTIINGLPAGCPERMAFALFLAKRADAALMAEPTSVQLMPFEQVRTSTAVTTPGSHTGKRPKALPAGSKAVFNQDTGILYSDYWLGGVQLGPAVVDKFFRVVEKPEQLPDGSYLFKSVGPTSYQLDNVKLTYFPDGKVTGETFLSPSALDHFASPTDLKIARDFKPVSREPVRVAGPEFDPDMPLMWSHEPTSPIGRRTPDGKVSFTESFRDVVVKPIVLNLGMTPELVSDEQAAELISAKMMAALDAIVYAPPKDEPLNIVAIPEPNPAFPTYASFWRTLSDGSKGVEKNWEGESPLMKASREMAAFEAVEEAAKITFANAVGEVYGKAAAPALEDKEVRFGEPVKIPPGSVIKVVERYGGQISLEDATRFYGVSRLSPGERDEGSTLPPQPAQALKQYGYLPADFTGVATTNQIREYHGLEPIAGTGEVNSVQVDEPEVIDMTHMIDRSGWHPKVADEFERRYKRPGAVADSVPVVVGETLVLKQPVQYNPDGTVHEFGVHAEGTVELVARGEFDPVTVRQGETLSVVSKFTMHPDGSITSNPEDTKFSVVPKGELGEELPEPIIVIVNDAAADGGL